jgi:hypothetical protein
MDPSRLSHEGTDRPLLGGVQPHLRGFGSAGYVESVPNEPKEASTEADVARASGIAMERYGLTEPRALALITRLAKRRGVALGVIAVAIIAASRRRADEG